MFTLYIYNFDHHCALCVPLPVNHCKAGFTPTRLTAYSNMSRIPETTTSALTSSLYA